MCGDEKKELMVFWLVTQSYSCVARAEDINDIHAPVNGGGSGGFIGQTAQHSKSFFGILTPSTCDLDCGRISLDFSAQRP